MNVNVKYLDLPCRVKAMTVKDCEDDDYYTIVLNSRLSHDTHLSSYQHELEHINCGDFFCEESIDYIESKRHK